MGTMKAISELVDRIKPIILPYKVNEFLAAIGYIIDDLLTHTPLEQRSDFLRGTTTFLRGIADVLERSHLPTPTPLATAVLETVSTEIHICPSCEMGAHERCTGNCDCCGKPQ